MSARFCYLTLLVEMTEVDDGAPVVEPEVAAR